jgi:eukaryotic-like serine/threonine-protein kinase
MTERTIDGRYRILRKLGEGAHGVVYQARDLETRELVALKFLNADVAANAEYMTRLEREAEAMARLRGTSAVYIHAMRRSPDGSAYLVMEMLVGDDLEQYLRAAEKLGGRLKPAKLAEILRPIVVTLSKAHAQGLVHRDLKPSNIFVLSREAGGGVRLLDFGLVKMLDNLGLTAEGLVAGTPSYIAPEAWRGKPLTLDHRIDVYSLGVIVFRALTGKVPFHSKSMVELLVWATRGERPKFTDHRPDLPPAANAWLDRALAIDPNARFQTVEQFWQELEPILMGVAA